MATPTYQLLTKQGIDISLSSSQFQFLEPTQKSFLQPTVFIINESSLLEN